MSANFHQEHITHNGIEVRVRYFYDHDKGAPWKECDGHGDVREVTSTWGRPDKRPGEVVMCSSRGTYWLYDYQGAVKKAKAEGWGCKNQTDAMTKNEVAAEAANEDMEFLQGWLNGDWHYVGVVCTVLDENGAKIDEDAGWGFESLDDYHETVGREMAEELADREAKAREATALAAAVEAVEVAYWASRDVVTEGGEV